MKILEHNYARIGKTYLTYILSDSMHFSCELSKKGWEMECVERKDGIWSVVLSGLVFPDRKTMTKYIKVHYGSEVQ